jgi:hypothetical protein
MPAQEVVTMSRSLIPCLALPVLPAISPGHLCSPQVTPKMVIMYPMLAPHSGLAAQLEIPRASSSRHLWNSSAIRIPCLRIARRMAGSMSTFARTRTPYALRYGSLHNRAAEVERTCSAYDGAFCIYPWYTLGSGGFHYGADYPDTLKDFRQADQFTQTPRCGGPYGPTRLTARPSCIKTLFSGFTGYRKTPRKPEVNASEPATMPFWKASFSQIRESSAD